MDIKEIKTLLEEHRDEIFSYKTKFDKIECLIRLIKMNYPYVSTEAVEYGTIIELLDAANHYDAQKVIQALRYLQNAKGKVVVISDDYEDNTNEIMQYIQTFLA